MLDTINYGVDAHTAGFSAINKTSTFITQKEKEGGIDL